MRQRDISKYRIMRVFKDSKTHTGQEVIRISGVKRAAAYPYLSELVKENRLTCSVGKDGKTKIYRRVNPHDPRPLLISGSRKKEQVQRLQKLGLKNEVDYLWIHRRRGRPKRAIPPNYRTSVEIDGALMGLLQSGRGNAIRHVVASTGMKFREWKNGVVTLSYSDKNRRMDRILEDIPKAKKHFDDLRHQAKVGRGEGIPGRPRGRRKGRERILRESRSSGSI